MGVRRKDATLAAEALVFVLALIARVGVTYARGGSFFDSAGYDPSVYYAAADALIHGRVPYRDFTLLHPPGIMLALSPAALVGRLTTDRAGFELANGLSLVVASVSAVLVARIARAMGLRRFAALAGGLLYALTLLSASTEFAARLEVFGNFLVLVGIWGYVTAAGTPGRGRPLLTGAALAAAASVKIWYAVPLVLVLLWHAVDGRPRRSVLWLIAGVLSAAAVIDGPFAALGGKSMLQMVVLDQLGRTRTDSVLARASDLDLLTRLRPHASTQLEFGWAVAAVVVVLAGLVMAWRVRPARIVVALFVASLGILFAAPVYFSSYADYVMPAGCLCAAAAVHAVARTRSAGLRRCAVALASVVVAGSVGSAVLIEVINPPAAPAPAPDRFLQRAAAEFKCVQSDSPEPLIALNVLSSDLQHGCPQWVDVSGRTYGVDRAAANVSRRRNLRWQRDLIAYLRSGQALVLVDIAREGLSRRTLALLGEGRAVARGDRLTLRRVVPARGATAAGV